ncbi:MAG: Fic family protein [Bifidobacteriaceae bacterium]|nr:Fic family protein [Bifidobacteriaceae bacterium]
MTQEDYPVDAARFRDVLLEQRAMQLTGGLYHLNQIHLAYNSNRIEGSQLSAEQTRYIYETQTVDGPVRVDDVAETVNHFRLFDLMLDTLREPLTLDRIKQFHGVLKQGTSDADRPWFAVGDWKRVANVVGGRATTQPSDVQDAMAALLAGYPNPAAMTFNDVCDFHHRFEVIHPFQDGNGRIGRIIMFRQCLAAGIMPFIVLDERKQSYYRGLAEYDAQPGFLRDTFRFFQDRYYDAYQQFVPLAGAGEP